MLEVNVDGSRTVAVSDDDQLVKIGEVPLPPYVRQPLEDVERYQTVYSRAMGSVAAPTAGLHFTRELLDRVRAMGVATVFVTLHVGWGSFRPVSGDDPAEHEMHSEHWELGEEAARAINEAKRQGRRIVSVGTTAVRLLEHAALLQEAVRRRRRADCRGGFGLDRALHIPRPPLPESWTHWRRTSTCPGRRCSC